EDNKIIPFETMNLFYRDDKEEYLKQVISNAPDAVIVIDENSIINLWNPKTEEIFGWKSEEVTGKPLTDTIIPLQYREAHKMGMKRLLETGEVRILNKTLEITALNKQGKEFYVSLTISQSLQQGRKMFIAFLRDISKEKQTQEQLLAKSNELEGVNESLEFKNFELERINKELESFNYIASHDLQEPLRKIQIFTNRILENGTNGLPKTAIENLDKIRTSSARMKMLIEDLLTFSQSTVSEENFESTDLNMLLEDVKNTLAAAIEENKAVVESAPLPTVRIVPFQFNQVLLNLISNAIKYSRNDAPVHIKITSDIVRGEKIKIHGAIPGKNYFELKVEDNGIGFDESNAEKIFGLFYRLHRKNEYSGTGIGLAICKKIVQNHNGFIMAKSVPGKGSVFYVYLPGETMLH
ncbi:MAG: PAS domain S-box protein, partial [Bacteroidota bacterium]